MIETTKEGTRVHVYSSDKKRDLGYGTIEKVEPLIIEELGLTISSTYPSSILLDNGKRTEGLECWWIKEEEERKLLQEKTTFENKLETMEQAIISMIQQIATHGTIKRQNSYAVLAGTLSSYSALCEERPKQEPTSKTEKSSSGQEEEAV